MKIQRMDRFGNKAAGGGSLAVTGHGPGRMGATVHDCGDGTSDIKCVPLQASSLRNTAP